MALHRRIAARLEASTGSGLASTAAELAMHLERGHEWQRALQYVLVAAEVALVRSAYGEASHHLSQGFTILDRLPASVERDQCELKLQALQGATLSMARGYAAPEVEQAYERARALCTALNGQVELLVEVLEGVWKFYLLRGDCRTAGELGYQALLVARKRGDIEARLRGQAICAVSCFYLVRLQEARRLLEETLPFLDGSREVQPLLHGEDTGVLVRSQLSLTL